MILFISVTFTVLENQILIFTHISRFFHCCVNPTGSSNMQTHQQILTQCTPLPSKQHPSVHPQPSGTDKKRKKRMSDKTLTEKPRGVGWITKRSCVRKQKETWAYGAPVSNMRLNFSYLHRGQGHQNVTVIPLLRMSVQSEDEDLFTKSWYATPVQKGLTAFDLRATSVRNLN